MTEFLKNNPIALRYCILYKFLQEQSVEKAFDDFQNDIGDDIIEKEEFEFWLDQFEQGVFDLHKEPIVNMVNFLRNNKKALRACVMYESISYQKNPNRFVTDSRFISKISDRFTPALADYVKCTKEFLHHPPFFMYEDFCKLIGEDEEDVMEYREFDFWFYRFSNGEMDLSFERNENEKAYELMDMPIDVMENIVEHLDIVDRTNLARTSQSLQTFVEDQKLFHEALELQFYRSSATTNFNIRNYEIYYECREDDCHREFVKEGRLIQGVPFWRQALLDFRSIIIKNPKLHLEILNLHSLVDSEYSNFCFIYLNNAFDIMATALNSNYQLFVKKLSIEKFRLERFLKILPYFKPGYLTTFDLNVYHTRYQCDMNVWKQFFESEQFKQAKYFYMKGDHLCNLLHHLFHLTEFKCRLQELSANDIHQMKEILFNSPNFERCFLELNYRVDRNAIRREFGDAIPENPDTHHYPIPNSTKYFEIIINDRSVSIEKKMM